ncbi:MAG TPA: glycosyltransferase family 39 protein [Usitatibacter sp.]|nr:glycosyltransferase family 39 protein [Usitatibacter sp.]
MLVVAALLTAGLGHPIQDDNEGLYARVAAEMLDGGSWIVPHLDGVPYLEKPPLLYWLTALAFRVLGHGDAVARLPAVLGALLVLSAVAVFAYRRREPRAALFSLLIVASFPLFLGLTRLLMFDMLLTGFLAWALVALHESIEARGGAAWMRASYAFLALAVLTKGLLAIVVFGLVALVVVAFAGGERPRVRRALLDPFGLAIFALVAVPWHLLAWLREPSFGWFYFVNEHVLRFLGLREPKDFYQGPWWYYLPRIAAASLPWAVLLAVPRITRRPFDATERFLWAWVLVPLVFFSTSIAKANYYMVIALPALSLLLGRRLADLRASRWGALAPLAWLCLVAAGATLAPRVHAPYRWPPETIPIVASGLALAALSAALFLARRPVGATIACAAFSVPLALFFSGALAANEDQDSARRIARLIERERFGDVFVYRDFENLSSLAFYLRRPIGVIDSASNDLRFGIALDPDARRFPSEAQFLRADYRGEVAVVVARSRLRELEGTPLARGLHPLARVGRLELFSWTPPQKLIHLASASPQDACASCKPSAGAGHSLHRSPPVAHGHKKARHRKSAVGPHRGSRPAASGARTPA